MSGILHHIDPTVTNVTAARPIYDVFFADPDGLKLEYVFTPPEAEVRV